VDNTLMGAILSMLTPQMRQALAARLGDSPQALQSGLGAATAATLGALASRAGDGAFLGEVMNLAQVAHDQNVLGSLSSVAAAGPSGDTAELVSTFLPVVFGSQQASLTSTLSQQTGLSGASVCGLLKFAAPLILAVLGRAQANGELDAASLGSTLAAQGPNLQAYLPADLFSSLGGNITRPALQRGASAGASRWIVPLAILGALILVWLVMRSMTGTRDGTYTSAGAHATGTASPWAGLGRMVAVHLPDGTALKAPAHGVEGRLVAYLNDSSAAVSDETWFDFDRLLFDTGNAALQPQSQAQIGNIAAILKAYPRAKVRIGGFTDNDGEPAANLKLSQDRADSVVAELAGLGVDLSRLEAKGYGDDHPVADNTTEDGRQKNRRISLRVMEK
jgi:outer membrane protein OmpA-like peptidoglycan-associated protein